MNVQGITRKKKDFTSLPLAKIQAFSVETAGTFDLDAELELWFSGLGKVKFEFSGKTDVAYLEQARGPPRPLMACGRLMRRSSRSAGSAWAGAGVAAGHGRRRWPIWSPSRDLPVLTDALWRR